MSGAAYPPNLLEPIASSAGPSFITNPLPETPPVSPANALSIQGGFPPNTMQSELSGGKPPRGQDMNGLAFLLSSHTWFLECGQLYQFNSTLAAAIGGYAAGTVLGMLDGTGTWLSTIDANTNDPDAGGAGWVPLTSTGTATLAALTGGTVVVPVAKSKKNVLILQGILTSNLTIQLPQAASQQWLIVNQTSGAFNTTIVTSAVGSVGVVAPQGGFAAPLGVYTAGDNNVYPTVAPLSIPISQGADPLTIAQRTNVGYLLATYFNQSSALETPTVGAVFVQNSAADGFLRKISLTNFESQLLLQGMGGQLVNGQVPYSVIQQWASTFFNSAALTGTPTAPNAALGTSNTQIATTAFANPASNISSGSAWHRQNADGSIEQGGTFTMNPTGGNFYLATLTFPIAFPNAAFQVVGNGTTRTNGGVLSLSGNIDIVDFGIPTLNDVVVRIDSNSGNSLTGVHQIMWRAIGR